MINISSLINIITYIIVIVIRIEYNIVIARSRTTPPTKKINLPTFLSQCGLKGEDGMQWRLREIFVLLLDWIYGIGV